MTEEEARKNMRQAVTEQKNRIIKAYLFIETGEFRLPKYGEWHFFHNDIRQSDGISNFSYRILTRHEIEIPEFATEILVNYGHGGVMWDRRSIHIPIPRPKKKVKKWRWVFPTKKGKSISVTTCELTEEKFLHIYPTVADKWYHKIPETEIEVEEE